MCKPPLNHLFPIVFNVQYHLHYLFQRYLKHHRFSGFWPFCPYQQQPPISPFWLPISTVLCCFLYMESAHLCYAQNDWWSRSTVHWSCIAVVAWLQEIFVFLLVLSDVIFPNWLSALWYLARCPIFSNKVLHWQKCNCSLYVFLNILCAESKNVLSLPLLQKAILGQWRHGHLLSCSFQITQFHAILKRFLHWVI